MDRSGTGRRRAASVAGIVLLVLLGIVAFASVTYVAPAVTSSEDVEAVVAIVLRLMGFGFLLGAGSLLVHLRRQS